MKTNMSSLNGSRVEHPESYKTPSVAAQPGEPTVRVLRNLKNVSTGTAGWTALCPAHGDTRNSLSVAEGDDGRVLLRCHAGCTFDDIVDALGVTAKSLFPQSKMGAAAGTNGAATAPDAVGLTLADYATAKKLTMPFLSKLGIRQFHLLGKPAIAMPYFDSDGKESAARFRLAMDKQSDRFRWRKGSKPSLYGLWQLSKFSDKKYIFIPEGESDSQTLWFHGIPALGLPGANSWKEEWADALVGFERIYVPIEPDKGGEAVLRWLAKSKIRERVRLVKLDAAKDVSELYLADPPGFRSALKAAAKAAQPWPEYENAAVQQREAELRKKCMEIAKQTDILKAFSGTLAKAGVTGEERASELMYLALTSRNLKKPVSLGVKGPSSGGKSYVVERVLEFFPVSAYYTLTAMSERALAYSEEPLSHRFIVLAEAQGLSSDFQSYLVRSLLSEGRLVYETVEKIDGRLQARRIEREGPTGLIVTTTAIALHPENETRYFSISVDDSPEQTARILAAEARQVSGQADSNTLSEEDLEKWRSYQEWLTVTARPVVVPYAPVLSQLVPPAAVRLRRDFKAILSLIQAHALLSVANRKTDAHGRIVATLDDYEQVRKRVRGVVMENAERGVSKQLRETIKAVAEICGADGEPQTGFKIPEASIAQIAKRLKLDRSTAQRRVKQCLNRDLLRPVGEVKKGQKLMVKLGDPVADNDEMLPTVEEIARKMA